MRATRATYGSFSNEDLAYAAPAVVAQVPGAKVSTRYGMFRTLDLVDALRETGWLPVAAEMPNARSDEGREFGRHVLRFRQEHTLRAYDAPRPNVGDIVPELVMFNAHDGTTAFRFMAGLFRFICSNGLVVADGTFGAVHVRHTRFAIREAQDAALQVVDEIPQIIGRVDAWRNVELNHVSQEIFAREAAELRGMPANVVPIPGRLLRARRYDDHGDTLWKVFNRVQESVLEGGYYGAPKAGGATVKVRKIGDVTKRLTVNRQLWELAEQYAQAA